MQKLAPGLLLLAAVLLWQCSSQQPAEQLPTASRIPDLAYEELFHDVSVKRLFADGKTFADATPLAPPATIAAAYEEQKNDPGFDLQAFVEEYFELPPQIATGFQSDPERDARAHIDTLWSVLTRPPRQETTGTLLPLPYPYVVPGGRFREIYYWDSYFTMLGLRAAGRFDLIENMVDNFAYLIDTLGFIPNGSRTYFLSRSQPPFFAAMVTLLAESSDQPQEVLLRYLPALEKEYAFWMDGEAAVLAGDARAARHVVRLKDGEVLNRYWDQRAAPRTEMYADDLLTTAESDRPDSTVYRNIRAACESGWDFSSRWFEDGRTLSTIETTELIPVDLNALLFQLENVLADAYLLAGREAEARRMSERTEARQAAVEKYCWDDQLGYFRDYDWREGGFTNVLSSAGMFPFFTGLATPEKAAAAARTLRDSLLRPGGVLTTQRHTGQQWDAPNGWAPLQWVCIKGLRTYGQVDLAQTIKRRWAELNLRVYRNTGKMVEKYNVEDMTLEAGGGEYPVQDGFGWTNGVLLQLLTED